MTRLLIAERCDLIANCNYRPFSYSVSKNHPGTFGEKIFFLYSRRGMSAQGNERAMLVAQTACKHAKRVENYLSIFYDLLSPDIS